MGLHEHAYELGSLLANFHSLEFILRGFLYNIYGGELGVPFGEDIYTVTIGHSLPENAFTNYDSLRELIAKYNSVAREHSQPQIDPTLVEIRDALAHGRVSAAETSDDLRLLKFSKPRRGFVEVTFNAPLSHDWFLEQRRRVREALLTVIAVTGPPRQVS